MRLSAAKVNFTDPVNGAAEIIAGDISFTFTDPYAIYLCQRESIVLLHACFDAAAKIQDQIIKIEQAMKPGREHPKK